MTQFAVSVAGIAAVTLAAWFIWGRRPLPPLSEADAMRLAAEALPGFRPERAICGQANRGALVSGAKGEIALLRAHGDHWAVRRVAPGASARVEGDSLIVRPAEPMFAPLRLDLGRSDAAEAWLRRIEGARG